MITPKQPLWINFYNLDAENLTEIVDLYCLSFLPIRVPRRADGSDEKVFEPEQSKIKQLQSELKALVDTWLIKIKPDLMQVRIKMKTMMVDDFLKFEREIISPFFDKLTSLSITSKFIFTADGKIRKVTGLNLECPWWINKAFQDFVEAVVNEIEVFRCEAYQTPRIPACRNIFVASGKQGPDRKSVV